VFEARETDEQAMDAYHRETGQLNRNPLGQEANSLLHPCCMEYVATDENR